MATKETQPGLDAIALITTARRHDTSELLLQVLAALKGDDDETMTEMIKREAQLTAALAVFAGSLADVIEEVIPGKVEEMLRRMALRWASIEEGS
jgi:hypothetical protein